MTIIICTSLLFEYHYLNITNMNFKIQAGMLVHFNGLEVSVLWNVTFHNMLVHLQLSIHNNTVWLCFWTIITVFISKN